MAQLDYEIVRRRWYPEVPPKRAGDVFSFWSEFANYMYIQVYHLKREEVDAEEYLRIKNLTKYVKTGETDYVKDRKIEGIRN